MRQSIFFVHCSEYILGQWTIFIQELSWINVNSTNCVTNKLDCYLGYVSLSKNECESFAVSFYLCFLLQESHPDWDFEGNLRERSLLSHFPSNNVHSILDSKDGERRLQAGACSIFRVQRYNIVIAVHEFFDNFF